MPKFIITLLIAGVALQSSLQLLPLYLSTVPAATVMTATEPPTTLVTPDNVSENPNSSDSIYYQFWWEGVTSADGTADAMSSIVVTGYPHLLYTASSDPLNPMADNWNVVMRNTLRTRYAETVFGEEDTRIVLSPDILDGVGGNRDAVNAEYSRIRGSEVLPVVSVPTFHVTDGGPNNPFIVVVYVYTPGRADLSPDRGQGQ